MVEKEFNKDNEKVHLKYFVADSKSLKVSDDANGHKLVEVPIQSLKEDRDGDVISEQGQLVLISALNRGLVPAFPNHGFGDYMSRYDFRDIMGNWVGGRLDDAGVTRGVLRLRKNNAAADHVLDLISQGMPLGFSVGFIPREVEERSNGGFLIHGLDLLEVSPVGIPSNPLAVVGYNAERVALAVKGVLESGKMSEVEKLKSEEVSEVQPVVEEKFEGVVESVEGSKACDDEEKKPKKEDEDYEKEEDELEESETDGAEEDSKEEDEEESEEDSKEDEDDSEESKEEDEEDKSKKDGKSLEIESLKSVVDELKKEIEALKKVKVEDKEKAVKGDAPKKIKTAKKEESKSVDSELVDGYSALY